MQALVRPRDVKLAKTDVERGVSVAYIERLRRIGPQVKLPSGEPLTVTMPKSEIDGIQDGDNVLLDLREAKVFVQDYVILADDRFGCVVCVGSASKRVPGTYGSLPNTT